jgi:hypothetical protein
MFMVRHGNKINGMENKCTWNNTRTMMIGFMCISKINLQKFHTKQNSNIILPTKKSKPKQRNNNNNNTTNDDDDDNNNNNNNYKSLFIQ